VPQSSPKGEEEGEGEPLCPPPLGTEVYPKNTANGGNYRYGYSTPWWEWETLAFPLSLNGKCTIVSMQGPFGGYGRDDKLIINEGVQFFPNNPLEEFLPQNYQESGTPYEEYRKKGWEIDKIVRTVISVETSLGQSK